MRPCRRCRRRPADGAVAGLEDRRGAAAAVGLEFGMSPACARARDVACGLPAGLKWPPAAHAVSRAAIAFSMDLDPPMLGVAADPEMVALTRTRSPTCVNVTRSDAALPCVGCREARGSSAAAAAHEAHPRVWRPQTTGKSQVSSFFLRVLGVSVLWAAYCRRRHRPLLWPCALTAPPLAWPPGVGVPLAAPGPASAVAAGAAAATIGVGLGIGLPAFFMLAW